MKYAHVLFTRPAGFGKTSLCGALAAFVDKELPEADFRAAFAGTRIAALAQTDPWLQEIAGQCAVLPLVRVCMLWWVSCASPIHKTRTRSS
jgi:hypothetical protein